MANSARAGRITVNLDAGTAQFVLDMDKANRKLNEFGGHAVSNTQAASAAIRVFEGNISNNIRAAEKFITTIPGVSAALKVAFPLFGAIALGGVLFELIKKANEAYDAFVKFGEAPKRIGQEFQAITQPIRIANDELAVTNDKLENQIAKLQGRPQNGLTLALDEARLMADKLAESLQRDVKESLELLQKEEVGFVKGLFTNSASTKPLTEQFKKFGDSLTDISLDVNAKILKETDPTKKADLFKEATERRKTAIESETKALQDQLTVSERIQNQHDHPKPRKFIGASSGVPIYDNSEPTPVDQKTLISQLKGQIDNLQQLQISIKETQRNANDKGTLDGLNKEKTKDPFAEKLAALRAERQGLQQELAATSATKRDPLMEAIAKGAADAGKEINALAAQHRKLSLSEVGDLVQAAQQNEVLKASIDLRRKGAEEQERTFEEGKRRGQELQDSFDREAEKKDEKLTLLSAETDAARRLSAAEVQGADAVARAQREIKLAGIEDKDVRAATRAKDEAEYAGKIAGTAAQIDRETKATQLLTAAELQGEEARRQAQLNNIRNSGESPDVIAARIRAQKAQEQLEDTSELKNLPASAGVKAYFQEYVDGAQSTAMQVKETLGGAFESLNDNLAKLVSGQKVSWSSFFQSISAQLAKMALQKAETGIAKNILGRLGTGDSSDPRNNPAAEQGGFTGIASKVAGIFGLGGAPGTKRDGSSTSSALYVTMSGLDGNSDGTSGVGGFGNLFHNGDGSSADQPGGGGIGGILTQLAFGGFRAEGGSVDPGQAYMVGERGPEMWTPPSKGTIVPNHALGGGTAYYSIDARGTDPAMTEQRTRAAIVAAHNSAVNRSYQLNQENLKRSPQR